MAVSPIFPTYVAAGPNDKLFMQRVSFAAFGPSQQQDISILPPNDYNGKRLNQTDIVLDFRSRLENALIGKCLDYRNSVLARQ